MDPTIPQPQGSTAMIASNSLELDARPSIDDDDEVGVIWIFAKKKKHVCDKTDVFYNEIHLITISNATLDI